MYCVLLDVNLFDTLLEHQRVYRHLSVLSMTKTPLLIFQDTAYPIIYIINKIISVSLALLSEELLWSLKPGHNMVSETFNHADKGSA